MSMRFCRRIPSTGSETNGVFGLNLDKADVMHLAQTALFGIIGIIALLLVLRPMVLRITSVVPGGISGGHASIDRAPLIRRTYTFRASRTCHRCRGVASDARR